MKTKILYPIIIGLCLMLCGMKSSAQCSLIITADAWTLHVTDTGSYTYTCSGQVWNSTRSCYSDVHNYLPVSVGPNSMPQNAYSYNHNSTGCTYWLHVVVTRSDGTIKTVDSTNQLPDLNNHISPGTLYVKFN